ncbi:MULTISPECIES: hypothetical protein [Bacillaceae]|uniref:hypothetical protein n=1 Tax=Bacillaceae TaxID=186817 RepID=UPI002A169DA6|nr:hypothetical protein [Cytobacillus sp. IB215316]MDX8362734.1 hypothetical protein [Cytobacillus sp. IB215316]
MREGRGIKIKNIKQYDKISGELLKALGYVDETLNNRGNKSIDEIRKAEYLLDRIQQDLSIMQLALNRRKKITNQGRIAK